MKLLLLRVKKNMTKDKLLKIVNGIETNQDMLEDQVNSVYLAIGSNLGNKIQNIQKSIFFLSRVVNITKISGYYETPSWPDKKKPKFVQ